MTIVQAITGIAYLARKADCKKMPRVSISFPSTEDRYRFEYELKRELKETSLDNHLLMGVSELTISGVTVRLV